MKGMLLIIGVFLSLALFSGCTDNIVENDKDLIVATFYPVEEIAKAIVGDKAEVRVLIPYGTEPHSFDLSPSQTVAFSKADVFITMEGMFENIEEKIITTNKNITVIDSTHGINLIDGEEHSHDDEEHSHDDEGHSHDDEEHSHDEEGHHHDEKEHTDSLYNAMVEYHLDHNEVVYSLNLSLPNPCYEVTENYYYEGDELIIELESFQLIDEYCIQVIDERYIENEIEIDREVHEVIILLNGEKIFEKDIHELEHGHLEEDSHNHEHEHGDYDPHVWLSINNMIMMTEEILEELIEIYPEHKADFERNAENYITELKNLKLEFDETLAFCEKNKIIVNHKAFGYLAYEYNFEQISVSGFSPESEPNPNSIRNVIDTAREYDLKYVFSEGQLDPKVSQTIAGDLDGEVLELNPVKMRDDEDYFSIMRANLESLSKGLECK